MSNKTEQAMNSLMNGMIQYVRNEINNIPYVKTDIGIVKSVTLTDGKYIHTVTVRNFDYTGIKSLGNNEFTANSVVYILVPNGQYSNMFILGHLDDTNANIKGGSINLGNGNFVVTNSGEMTAKSGFIGNGNSGFTISNTAIYNSTNSMSSTTNGLYLGTDGINLAGKFKVNNDGSASMTSGTIGAWSFNSNGFTFSNSQGASGYMKPSTAGGLGGIEIGSQSVSLTASRTVSLEGSLGVTLKSTGGAISLNGGSSEPIETLSNNNTNKVSGAFKIQNIASTDLFYVNQTSAWSKYTIQTSDKKLKKNIKKLNKKDSADFIISLKPCEYKFKDGDDNKHHGFIAQEVEEISDKDWGIVTESETSIKGKEEKIKGIAYTEIIADLVATVQLQQEQIDNLKKDIEILKKGE